MVNNENLMKKYMKLIGIFAGIGLIAGVLAGIIQEPNLPDEIREVILNDVGSMNVFYIIAGIQIMVYTVLTSLGGFFLAEKLNLNVLRFSKNRLWLPVALGTLSAMIIVFGDAYVFASFLPTTVESYEIDFTYLMAGIIYGGIIEEILLRLFFLTLLLFLFQKISKSKASWTSYTAVIVSAIVFGLLHLPAMALIAELTPMIAVRTVLLNALPGMLFGYIYLKEGLWYSMLTHMFTHIVMQLILMPLVY